MSKQTFPFTCRRENLDGPIDENIQVTGNTHSHTLRLLIDGECVSWATIIEFEQQIGTEVLRMGGIGGVGTHEGHRLKGYSRRVMENALRWMRLDGFDVSMLFGISDFYPKFGYAEAFPDVSFTLAVRDAEAGGAGGHRLVNFEREHLGAILSMYHQNNTERTGPIRRNPRYWKPLHGGLRWDSKSVCRVALNDKKVAVGYFVYNADYLNPAILEIGYVTPKVFPSILREIARTVWKQRLDRITFFLPEDHAFMAFCQPLGLQKSVGYRRDGGAMVRLINIPGAIGKIAPLLGSCLPGQGRLDIQTNLESVGLSWKNGKCNVRKLRNDDPSVRLPQWALAQLLYGYQGAGSLAAAGVVKTSKHNVYVLEKMFPVIPHFYYHVDRF